jgi:hypothetical protein
MIAKISSLLRICLKHHEKIFKIIGKGGRENSKRWIKIFLKAESLCKLFEISGSGSKRNRSGSMTQKYSFASSLFHVIFRKAESGYKAFWQ